MLVQCSVQCEVTPKICDRLLAFSTVIIIVIDIVILSKEHNFLLEEHLARITIGASSLVRCIC